MEYCFSHSVNNSEVNLLKLVTTWGFACFSCCLGLSSRNQEKHWQTTLSCNWPKTSAEERELLSSSIMSTGLVQIGGEELGWHMFSKRDFLLGGSETNFLVLSLTIALVYKMWDCNMICWKKKGNYIYVFDSLLTWTAQSKIKSIWSDFF